MINKNHLKRWNSIFILGFILLLSSSLLAQNLIQRDIKVDSKSIKGNKSLVFNECIGAGRANEGLRADWQQQLAKVQKDINFKYIRFHGLLQDDMGVYK